MTDMDRNSKPDTVLLLDIVAGDPWTDYSQYRTSLTDQGTYLEDDTLDRTAFVSPREITLVWDIQSGDSGTLIEMGNAGSFSYRITKSGSNILCRENGLTRIQATLPSILVGTDTKYLIHWSCYPFSTGTRSELMLHNYTSGETVIAQATHVAGTITPGDILTVGGTNGGGSLFTGGLDFHYVRVGRRFHSTSEAREDWITETTPPSVTQVRRDAAIVPNRATVGIAADNELVGPALMWTGWAFLQADRRLQGPLVNTRVPSPLQVEFDYQPE